MYRIIRNIIVLGLLTAHFVQAVQNEEAPRAKYRLEYPTPEAFMNDFKDLSKKAKHPLKYWAAQLIMFLQDDPKMKLFCLDLAKNIRYKSPLRIGYIFLKHQDLFTQDLQDLVLKDFNHVYHALDIRCKI